MAFAFVAEIEASSTASGSSLGVTLGTAATAGNVLHVNALLNADTTCTFTDTQSNTFTPLGSVREAAIAARLFHAYAANVVGGADTVTATFGAAGTNRGIYVLEISGLASSPADGHNEITDTGNNPTDTNTVTATGGPGVMVSVGSSLQGGLLGTGTGMTVRTSEIWAGTYRTKVQYKAVAAAGSVSANFVNASFDRNVHTAVVYDEAVPYVTRLYHAPRQGKLRTFGRRSTAL